MLSNFCKYIFKVYNISEDVMLKSIPDRADVKYCQSEIYFPEIVKFHLRFKPIVGVKFDIKLSSPFHIPPLGLT